ncbi:hypothetical protein [Paraburkholderia sp. C35]|uniref:hypothetical protein n=1 Tax=Paraburkholderia sp. C35 TaxID=2126993 RepID=UPI0013A54D38|nr:hypothetical protein [Paraburkholderia sp. C35]
MKREPVYVGERLTGHNVHYPPVYITVRDMRGYDSIIQARPARVVFEPIKGQPGLFE